MMSCRSAPASRSAASSCARPPGLSSMVAAHTSTCSTYSTRGSITVLLPLNTCEPSAISCAMTPTHKAPHPHLAFESSDVAMEIACRDLSDILLLSRNCFNDNNQKTTVILEVKQNTGNGEGSGAPLLCGAVGLRGRRVCRQEMRCAGKRVYMKSALSTPQHARLGQSCSVEIQASVAGVPQCASAILLRAKPGAR